LQLEWKISKRGNSGIIFNIQEDKKCPATYLTGPEMQVLDNIDASDNKKQTTWQVVYMIWLVTLRIKAKPVENSMWCGFFKNKGHLTLWLNGIKTYEGQIGSEEWNTLVAKVNLRTRHLPTLQN
jgi:hypothetical protein